MKADPPQSPIEHYRALLHSGEFQPDPAQGRAAEALDRLYRTLKTDWPGKMGRPGRRSFLGRLQPAQAIKGLYIHGGVGRGKSRLMDLFFQAVPGEKKRRIHFNAFMAETHARIHAWRTMSATEKSRSSYFVKEAGDDPIAPIARRIFSESPLLCFDEFQVTDVADAMILGRLFEKLLALGAVLVMTSNTPPDELYRGGLNRQLFLPFIALLRERLDMLELDGPRDYRLGRMAGLKLYLTPLGGEADAAMDAAWLRLTETVHGEPQTLHVLGRQFLVPQAAKGVARFSFEALCATALGTADYLALAHEFHTLILDHVPRMTPAERNEARRFTLLIDTLYDEKVKLICSAASSPFELYSDGDNSEAFKRAASRLCEMQSVEYLRLEHSRSEQAATP